MPSLKTSTVSVSITAGDTAKPIVSYDLPYYECNIHIYTHDVYYGDGTTMSAIAKATDVIYFKNGNLRDFFVKNYTAGNNASVVAVAICPTKFTKGALQL